MLTLLVTALLVILGWLFPTPITILTSVIVIYLLFQAYIPPLTINPDPQKFNPDEILILKKYYTFIRYPLASRSFSRFLAGVQFIVIIFLSVIAVINQQYWLLPFTISSFLACALTRPRLDPVFFNNEIIQKSKDSTLRMQSMMELDIIDNLIRRFHAG